MSGFSIDDVIANGFLIDKSATHLNLDSAQREKFALLAGGDYKVINKDNFKVNEVLLCNGNSSIWTTPQLLSSDECQEWIKRAEAIQFEEGDFIFKTGKDGYERMETGGRRSSSTMVVTDLEFASKTKAILLGHIPDVLSDGRKFVAIRDSFLVSKYRAGQYFAPHYDGITVAINPITGDSMQSAFTAVLYLSDDFTGGSTHYLPGPGNPTIYYKPIYF